jgi:signal transduction histidine kinase
MMDNIIINAIKHNPSGTTIEVIVEDLSDYNGFIVMIKDNGIGMDEETKKHLFSRYYRGTNTDESIEGSGLGMSIAMEIAVLSKHGDGSRVSCFTFLFE